jgi:ankyrin repeat protein
MACSTGKTEVVNFLISHARASGIITDNFVAFFAACESGQAVTASLLIKEISVSTFCRVGETGESCLMASCRNGHLDVVILLLDRIQEFKVFLPILKSG